MRRSATRFSLSTLLEALRAGSRWRPARAAASRLRRRLRRLLRQAGRQPSHLARVLRRLRSRIKARRQGKSGTELQ